MRVVLLQLGAHGRGGAANLQSVMAAIDRAASGDSEPDLLVLPAGCDFGGQRVTTGVAGRFSTFSESVAWKARDWGLYIAIGLHVPTGLKCRPAAILYDPDGDIVLRTDAGHGHGQQGRDGEVAWLPSAIGWIGVLDPGTAVSKMPDIERPRDGGFLACPLLATRAGASERGPAPGTGGPKPACGVYWGVAGWVVNDNDPRESEHSSAVLGAPKGAVVRSVSETTDGFVFAEIDLPSVLEGTLTWRGSPDPQAD